MQMYNICKLKFIQNKDLKLKTKYYIYLQRLFNNNQLDVYSCQALIKSALDIENEICIKNRITVKFQNINFLSNKIYNNNYLCI